MVRTFTVSFLGEGSPTKIDYRLKSGGPSIKIQARVGSEVDARLPPDHECCQALGHLPHIFRGIWEIFRSAGSRIWILPKINQRTPICGWPELAKLGGHPIFLPHLDLQTSTLSGSLADHAILELPDSERFNLGTKLEADEKSWLSKWWGGGGIWKKLPSAHYPCGFFESGVVWGWCGGGVGVVWGWCGGGVVSLPINRPDRQAYKILRMWW